MAEDFSTAVDYGLRLSKRIYYGKDRSASAPKPQEMEKSESQESFLPTAPMVYAVIPEPSIVDNPDVPSYQPYVHGRCDPPALIPLHMLGIAMEVDCYLDTAFISVSGTWRVHCVMGSRRCDCRVAIPMGEQGSVLGVEVDVTGRSCNSRLITEEDTNDNGKPAKTEDGRFLRWRIYTLKVPKVEGGTNLSIKFSWSQKLLYQDGQFSLIIPFSFPTYVTPAGKKIPKKETIRLNVNSGTGTEILCKATSHLLKELRRQVGKLGFLYEAEVQTWSRADFNFSYTVSSNNIFGGVLMQSPSVHDFDQREMFCFYLFPGSNISGKVFRKEVVFIVDISRSMRGRPLENTKDAVLAALLNLNTQDSFNIIAFNGDTCLFSSTMVLATKEEVGNATQWINTNFTAEGGTNILNPLSQAIEMLTKTSGSMPLIFLITDGAVEDERHICNVVEGHLRNRSPIGPRICTFGIGSYCNHYFLQMLAQIGRGYYDAAYDADSIAFHMQRLFTKASSVILANITIETLEHLDSLELFPFHIPDLSSGSPLIISGRYHGEFPESLKASGSLADMSNFTLELKIRKAKEIPLDRVFARRQINLLTVQAWLSESKQLEDKIAKMSMQTGFPSEYTCMILLVTDKGKQASESVMLREKMVDSTGQKIILLGTLGIGFGNLTATSENLPSGVEEPKPPEGTDVIFKAATNCCAMVADRICCMCFIQACSKLNNQCAIAFTQLCSALTCFGCMDCCCELCVSCG